MVKTTEEKVVEAVEQEKLDKSLITLSTGVVLRGKPAPALALVRTLSFFPRPKPPTYFNEKMGRELENPDDPDYLERIQAYRTESAAAMLNALILYGTELESVPRGFPKPESNDWLDEYSLLGLPAFPEKKSWRYLTWIMFKAAPKAEDTQRIQEVVGSLSGVPEKAVQTAEEFPGS